MSALKLGSEYAQAVERQLVIFQRPGFPQSALDGGPVALGQVLQDVSLLMTNAALHRCPLAEHIPDRLAQRFRAVDHEQRPLLGVEAALDQV